MGVGRYRLPATVQHEPFAPSGQQIPIARGDQRATVVAVGGGLRSYIAGGLELLDGYAEGEPSTAARGQLLIPWPNRLRDGVYTFDTETYQLPLSEPEKHNAIHGLVRWADWTVADRAEDRVVMAHTLHPQDGWRIRSTCRPSICSTTVA